MIGALLSVVLLAVPEDPEAALAALEKLGPGIGDCQPERIEDQPQAMPRPAVSPALKGKAAELMPYLDHPSRRVVLRAAQLVCHSDADDAAGRLVALARKFPCERELNQAANSMIIGHESIAIPQSCPWRPAQALLAPAQKLGAWKADPAAAKAISSGDRAALDRVIWRLEAIDPELAQSAAATLAHVDSPAGALAVLERVKLKVGFEYDAMARGVLGAQLEAIAAARKISRAAAFCTVVATAGAGDQPLLTMLANLRSVADPAQLSAEADVARRAPELTPFARAFLEQLAADKRDWMTVSGQVRAWAEHHDRPALRKFVADPAHFTVDRMDAAEKLADLGDASGLVLWQSSEGLWPAEREKRRQLLVSLSHASPEAVRVQAEALLAKAWPQ